MHRERSCCLQRNGGVTVTNTGQFQFYAKKPLLKNEVISRAVYVSEVNRIAEERRWDPVD